MKLNSLKVLLISSLVVQVGCDISFKRKSSDSNNSATMQKVIKEREKKHILSSKKSKDKKSIITRAIFSIRDKNFIGLYYTDEGNAQILEDIIQQTWISKKISEKLTVTERIPRDVQVVPLPLALEKTLSLLPRYALRVQIGKHIIIMDIKSRRIIDVIKL